MSYTFNLVTDAEGDNETDTENLTAIKVNMADIVVKKYPAGKRYYFYILYRLNCFVLELKNPQKCKNLNK